MREILNWIRINLFSNEIFDDYLIPKMTDPHCESSACAVLKSCGTAVTKSIVIASLAVLTLTGCNTTKTQMKQYDQWDAWVGCYSDLNSAMSRGIILENGNIGFKHRTNSGKLLIEIADQQGNVLVPKTDVQNFQPKSVNAKQIQINLYPEHYRGCFDFSTVTTAPEIIKNIYLLGEEHSNKAILDRELAIWKEHYEAGMRDMVVELPYYSAEFLNQWMHADNDDILLQLFDSMKGTASASQDSLEFYKAIKANYPQTVFHGTDVGHQYDTMGKHYLEWLERNQLQESEAYRLTQTNIQQGKSYYHSKQGTKDYESRENAMANNLIFVINRLKKPVMGIFGGAHTENGQKAWNADISNMITMLNWHYQSNIQSVNMLLEMNTLNYTEGTITLAGKTYKTREYAPLNFPSGARFKSQKFTLVEDAYDDFKALNRTGDYLPVKQYPVLTDKGQIYIIETMKHDGSILKFIHATDGGMKDNEPVSYGFEPEGI